MVVVVTIALFIGMLMFIAGVVGGLYNGKVMWCILATVGAFVIILTVCMLALCRLLHML